MDGVLYVLEPNATVIKGSSAIMKKPRTDVLF